MIDSTLVSNTASTGGAAGGLIAEPSCAAVDAGSICGPVDQNGGTRPLGGGCDIGSVESF